MRENEQLREQIKQLREQISSLVGDNREIPVSTASPHAQSETSSALPPPSSRRARAILPLRERIWAVILAAIAVVVPQILYTELWALRASEEEIEAATRIDIPGVIHWHFVWFDILLLGVVGSGFWVATRQLGRHLKTYIFLGTITSLVAMMALSIYEFFKDISMGASSIGVFLFTIGRSLTLGQFSVGWLWYSNRKIPLSLEALLYTPDALQDLVFGYLSFAPLLRIGYTIIVIALFVSGALFGDLIERIRFPQEAEPGLPEQIAKRITKKPSLYRGLANAIRALLPIFLVASPLWQPVWGELVKQAFSKLFLE